jgi:hypothetical protein
VVVTGKNVSIFSMVAPPTIALATGRVSRSVARLSENANAAIRFAEEMW